VPQAHVVTGTSVENVGNKDITKKTALSRIDMLYGMHPKYLRYNLWDNEERDVPTSKIPPDLADWTETVKPLPTVPRSEFGNIEAMRTVKDNPNLLKIVTPVDVDRFERLLVTHPNRAFVESVCRGLREGFWPWAETQYEAYPCMVDESLGMPQSEEEGEFLQSQREHKHSKGRFSGSFGRDLLPGMHASPIHAVPKPCSEKL